MTTIWTQKTISVTRKRGCHYITDDVKKVISEDVKKIKIGTVNLFLQHCSAAITVNECYDPSVMTDLNNMMDRIVPQGNFYIHTDEGPDDAPSHVKCALIGPSITIPISNGQLKLGTWQGIILCEFRDEPKNRNIVATINGVTE